METQTLTVVAAAKLLGISRGTAYRAAHRGELPVLKFGKRMMVPREALEQMLRTASRQSPTETPSGS